jgi:transcriptional regulator with XRE-family HTH domain
VCKSSKIKVVKNDFWSRFKVKVYKHGAQKMLRELMYDRRINQSQLGRETGIPQATISRYLNGTTKSLKFDTLKSLADYFSVTMEQIVRSDQPKTFSNSP